jgi:cob(I)alamin adenosyltransferase
VKESASIGVGELARQAGTTVRAIRHYEQIGLLNAPTRSGGGHRRYGRSERARLLRILALRDLGVPLERIAGMVDGQDAAALLAVLREHRAVLVERQGVLADPLARLDHLTATSHTAAAGSGWGTEVAFTLREGIAVSIALTRIYTRTGDDGSTGLGAPGRVPKTAPLIEVIGSIDELCAAIGMALPHCPDGAAREVLWRIQNEPFDVGADLATQTSDELDDVETMVAEGEEPPVSAQRERRAARGVTSDDVRRLEDDCDRFNTDLPQLRSFVLPAQSSPAANCTSRAVPTRRTPGLAFGRRDQPPDHAVPEPALGPAVHPGPRHEHQT